MLDNRLMKRASLRRRKLNISKLLIVAVIAVGIGIGVKALADPAQTPATSKAATTPKLRNEVRKENLKMIAGAIQRYQSEVGAIPVKIPTAPTGICSGASSFCKKHARFDPAFLISTGYLNSVPNDPVGGHDLFSTGYTIVNNAGAITLAAPRAESGATITEQLK